MKGGVFLSDAQTQARKRQEYFASWYRSEHGQAVIRRGRDRRAVRRTQTLMRQFGIAGGENLDELIDLLAQGGDLDAGD